MMSGHNEVVVITIATIVGVCLTTAALILG